MRILLDSRDLINIVEHGRPITADDFDAYLRARNHEIVLSFTNVRELSSPLAAGAEFMRIRPYLQTLERMPHVCVKETTIIPDEIRAAVTAFIEGVAYRSSCPYVPRWDHTLIVDPQRQHLSTENWVDFRLDEIIYYINRVRPDVFTPPERHLPRLQTQLENDRAQLRAGQAAPRQHFARAIANHAATHRITLPQGREDEFTRWVHANPDRCPGFRLNHEVYRALMANYGDVPEAADFSDLAHVSAVPYVDAATFDRRMRHYCSAASRKTLRLGGTRNYGDRLYQDVADFMQRNP